MVFWCTKATATTEAGSSISNPVLAVEEAASALKGSSGAVLWESLAGAHDDYRCGATTGSLARAANPAAYAGNTERRVSTSQHARHPTV